MEENNILTNVTETVETGHKLICKDNLLTLGISAGLVAGGFVGKVIIDKIKPIKRLKAWAQKQAEQQNVIDSTATVTEAEEAPKEVTK